MENILFQTSLLAAFVAGMVALFAPCCITFLLPAYLGTVFKEKEKILLMTVVFGLGIFVVLLPAVLGVAFISKALFRYHDTIYIVGGLLMLIISAVSLLGIKLPMPASPPASPRGESLGGPHLAGRNLDGRADIISVFTLGIFSGITSACCAPVLMGILTFAFLSPSFFGALLIGVMYVLGMVVPLLFISAFLSGRMLKMQALRRPITTVTILDKRYVIVLSNVIAGAIFLVTGLLTLYLTFTGRLTMGSGAGFTLMIQNAGYLVNQYIGNNIALNIIFLAIVIYLLYRVWKKV